MRGLRTLSLLALALAATPALADDNTTNPKQAVMAETQVRLAVNAFLNAISSDDKTDLADHMIPEAVIFVHNRMDPENPRVDIVPVADHLARWATRDARFMEDMGFTSVLVDGDMAQVWGPYSFWVNYELSHCGINSLSLVRMEDGWKIANTSFTMAQSSECERLGVPGFPAEEIRDEPVDEVPEAAMDAIKAASGERIDRLIAARYDPIIDEATRERLAANPPHFSPDRVPEGMKAGRCLLEVDGETVISGPCPYVIREGGSFTFNGPRQSYPGVDYPADYFPQGISTDHFVYVTRYDDVDGVPGPYWVAHWNEDKRTPRAQWYLGEVEQDGACFTNERTKICLWES